jgi:hypothetical protein
MDESKKRLIMVGGAATAALLAAVAQAPIGPSPLYSGRAKPKPQRIGPPKLTGKRLARLLKSMPFPRYDF